MIFRRLAAVLAILAALELAGILATPSYDAELAAAKAAYQAAAAENARLLQALADAADH